MRVTWPPQSDSTFEANVSMCEEMGASYRAMVFVRRILFCSWMMP